MFSTRHRRLLLFSRDCYRALSTVATRRVEPTDSFFWHAEVGRFPIEIPTTVDHSFYEPYSAQLFKELPFEQEEQVDSVQVLPDDEILRIYGPPDLSQRFSQAVEHNDSHGVSKNFLLMSRKGYSTRHTVRDWITAAIKQNSDRHAIVKRWKTIATMAKSTEGVDILWEQLFTDKQSLPTPNLFDEVLSVLRQLENPPDTLAQLVCSLIRVEKSDLAMKIALKTSLVGYRLWRPLMRLKQQRDLKAVEKLAHILSETVVAELHQRKGPKTEQAPSPEKEALLVAVANFIGESSRRPTKRYKKPKRLRVKETALFTILEQIRDTWYGLAEDAAARERCNQWCSHNGVEPYPTNS